MGLQKESDATERLHFLGSRREPQVYQWNNHVGFQDAMLIIVDCV